MYRWYTEAEVCYVHLADILLPEYGFAASRKFVDSEWFERGWTLQELLAPKQVTFYDQQWQEIGTKRKLKSYISSATGIPTEYLVAGYEFKEIKGPSIAQRMSWASFRKTSRPEDIAYCLLGIMGVNMPLLYGEGTRAFSRLQKELIRNGSDESIYAWAIPSDLYCELTGMLAPSPRYFEGSGTIRSIDLPDMRHTPLSITNRGLALTVASRKCEATEEPCCYEVPYACVNIDNPSEPLRLYLCQNEDGTTDRVQGQILHNLARVNDADFTMNSFYVKLEYWGPNAQDVSTRLYSTGAEFLLWNSEFIEFGLSPAVQQCECETDLSKDWQQVSTAQMAFTSRDRPKSLQYIALKLYYKETHVIHTRWDTMTDSLFVGLVGQNDLVHVDISSKEDVTSTDDIGEQMNGSGPLTDDDSKFICDGISFCEIDDCYARKLGDDDFLWISRKDVGNSNQCHHVLIEIDISPIDRGKIF